MPLVLFPTAFGSCGIAWEGDCLTGFHLPHDAGSGEPRRPAGEGLAPPVSREPPPAWVAAIVARVQQHVEGRLQDFSDLADEAFDWSRVTEFQHDVYRETLAIKPGFTRSYGDLARALSPGPEAARAVGMALGSNPWPLLVPCHRVVASNGRMTGFSGPGGIRTKTRLLALEGAELLSE